MTPAAESADYHRGLLVIHPGAIGDVLLTRPVLHRLRQDFPQHEIALLADEPIGRLLQEGGDIDRLFPLHASYLSGLFVGSDRLQPKFKRWLETCDLSAGWLRDSDGAVARTLYACGVSRVHLAPSGRADSGTRHQSLRYADGIGVEIADQVALTRPLRLPTAMQEQGRAILRSMNLPPGSRPVALHPGSGSRHKCLPATRWMEVIDWLRQAGAAPLLIEGPSDQQMVGEVQQHVDIPLPVLRDQPLSHIAGLLSHVELYLGHDSGITHVAAASAIPTLACFGPTAPSRWAPLGSNVCTLSGPLCVCADWDAVQRCREKPCLNMSSTQIIDACRRFFHPRRPLPETSPATLSLT